MKKKREREDVFSLLNKIDELSLTDEDFRQEEEDEKFLDEDEKFWDEVEVEGCSVCGSLYHDEGVHWADAPGISRKPKIIYDDTDDWIEYISKKRQR